MASNVGLRAVDKTFADGTRALDGVDLDVPGGQLFTVLGPSGCGKSTALAIIAGLDQPTSGHVEIDGRDVTNLPAHRRQVNTVFQSYALFEHMNVADNIGFGLRMRGVKKPEIRRAVEDMAGFLRIRALLRSRIGQLSGGERQRVALARALVNAPRVLLLDEPLSALDAELRTALADELADVQRALGITLVFVTHDQAEAMKLGDRMAVMQTGRIVQTDTPRGIYEKPATAWLARFMGLGNLWPIRGYGADGRVYLDFTTLFGLEAEGDYVLVRPEMIALTTAPPRGPNDVTADIVQAVFAGPSIDYRLHCNGQRMRVLAPNDGRMIHAPGTCVTARIPVERAALINA